jgi:hypothetical protein
MTLYKTLPQDPELLLDVSTPVESTLQRPELHLDVSTPQGPELHLDMSTLQRPVLLLDVSATQGPELHFGLSGQQKHVLLPEVSTQQLPVLHLNVSTQQRPLLVCCIWTCLHNRGLFLTWTCQPAGARTEADNDNLRFLLRPITFLYGGCILFGCRSLQHRWKKLPKLSTDRRWKGKGCDSGSTGVLFGEPL